MADADFQSGFSFETPQHELNKAPWDLTVALKAADREATGTSVDFKIDRRLRKQAKKNNVQLTGHKRKHEGEPEEAVEHSDLVASANSTDEEDESESDDDDSQFESDSGSEPGALDSDVSDSKSDHTTEEMRGISNAPEVEDGSSEEEGSEDDEGEVSEVEKKRQKDAPSKRAFFQRPPESTRFKVEAFTDLHLSRPLIKACNALGYVTPTPIQAACIPLALAGRDICGSAVTGSGKTAAFTLPLLERLLYRPKKTLATYVLILTPTRELAVQVHSMVQNLAQFSNIRVALIVGGLSLHSQASFLRTRPEIVVATPGRIIDHLRNSQSVGLEELQALVFDEADKLLQMGFKDEIEEILRLTPKLRQTMLFSATMTSEVKSLMALSLQNPVRLAADPSGKVPKNLVQEVVRLKGGAASKKEAIVIALCSRTFKDKTIVFCKTKQQAHRLKVLFGLLKLPQAGELHGNMAQADRLKALESFRKGENSFLLATDVAGRGLDILGVEVVINMDAPYDLDTYLHRIGRTARAGAKGRSVTFITDEDRKLVKQIIKKTGSKLANRSIPQKVVDKFQQLVSRHEDDMGIIFSQEQEERIIRKAEMDAEKAQNMLDHSDEIFSRPKRTWFQDWKAKKESAMRCKAIAEGRMGDIEDLTEGREKQRIKEKGRKPKKEAPQIVETRHLMGGVTAIKKSIRELQSRGFGARQAELMAASEHGPKKKKKKQQQQQEGEGDNGLFDGNGQESGFRKKAKVYPGGGSSGHVRKEDGRNPRELAKLKRGGKSRHAFKGKRRYKRK